MGVQPNEDGDDQLPDLDEVVAYSGRSSADSRRGRRSHQIPFAWDQERKFYFVYAALAIREDAFQSQLMRLRSNFCASFAPDAGAVLVGISAELGLAPSDVAGLDPSKRLLAARRVIVRGCRNLALSWDEIGAVLSDPPLSTLRRWAREGTMALSNDDEFARAWRATYSRITKWQDWDWLSAEATLAIARREGRGGPVASFVAEVKALSFFLFGGRFVDGPRVIFQMVGNNMPGELAIQSAVDAFGREDFKGRGYSRGLRWRDQDELSAIATWLVWSQVRGFTNAQIAGEWNENHPERNVSQRQVKERVQNARNLLGMRRRLGRPLQARRDVG